MMQTSIMAYREETATFQTQREKIVHWMKCIVEPVSMNDISRITGIRINAVCGRINELKKQGKVQVIGIKDDRYTHKMNKTYRLA